MGLMLFEMVDSDWSLSISEASASFMSSHIHFYDAWYNKDFWKQLHRNKQELAEAIMETQIWTQSLLMLW